MSLTLLFPWFAVAGVVAAAAVVATHLLSARTRAPAPLPTTRFVPRLQERSAAVERRPRDILLLLLRAGALALVGVALAAPVTPRAGTTVRIAIADVAGSGNPSEVVDRARQIVGDNGRVVISDTGLRVVGAGDPGEGAHALAAPSSLTAALVRAMREAAALGGHGNPVELAIVSGFTQSTFDSATAAVRALWPGTVRLVDMPVTTAIVERGPVRIRGDDDDPLRPTVELLPAAVGVPTAVVRDAWLAAADSLSAREGGVIVHWPRGGIPQSFRPAAADTVGGVWVGGYTLVAPFPREAVLSAEDGAFVVARWIDGTPAAVERSHGAGCIREVAISVPTEGDLSISPGFRRIVAALAAPCGAPFDSTPLKAADRAALAGSGPREVVLHSASSSLARSQLAAPLLLLALLVLLAELGVRKNR